MPAHEIPHPLWPSFLGKFGFRHFAWNVTVEQKSRGRGKLIAADHCFLGELTAEGLNGRQRITIVLGSPFHGFHRHVVSQPRSVRVADGEEDALHIDSADGSTTIVRVRQPDTAA